VFPVAKELRKSFTHSQKGENPDLSFEAGRPRVPLVVADGAAAGQLRDAVDKVILDTKQGSSFRREKTPAKFR
jgi:hypothetical protein